IDDHPARRRANLREGLAVRAADLVPVGVGRREDAGADDIRQRRARLRERPGHDLEAEACLRVRARRRIRPVSRDGCGSRDPHVIAVDDRARVAKHRLHRRMTGDAARRHARERIPWGCGVSRAGGDGHTIGAMRALEAIDRWEARHAAAGVVGSDGVVARRGDEGHRFRWASVTKPATALAALVALEEGVIDLDEPAGPPGATVRHLLAHASGLPFDGDAPIAEPGKRRIYSNTGFEQLAAHIEAAAEMPFADYLHEAVFGPLGAGADLRGSAGVDVHGSLDDALKFAAELLRPTVIAPETLAEATTVQFAGLAGVIPGIRRFDPNDWGLGFGLRDAKSPHWTGTRNSPRTYGHFGGSGTFLWIDPEADFACVALSDREFAEWALEAWPRLSDAVLSASS